MAKTYYDFRWIDDLLDKVDEINKIYGRNKYEKCVDIDINIDNTIVNQVKFYVEITYLNPATKKWKQITCKNSMSANDFLIYLESEWAVEIKPLLF